MLATLALLRTGATRASGRTTLGRGFCAALSTAPPDPPRHPPAPTGYMLAASGAMAAGVAASNLLVQYPINPWLTWGAAVYPLCFVVTDITNRWYGPQAARRVILSGFVSAVGVSCLVAPPRIVLASTTAFATSQLLDVALFDRLRHQAWYRAPLISSSVASLWDTVAFFAIAFAGTDVPWQTLLVGDYLVKVALAALSLVPYRVLLARGPLSTVTPRPPSRHQ